MLELLSFFFFLLSLPWSLEGAGVSPPAALATLTIGPATVAVANIARVKNRIAVFVMRLSSFKSGPPYTSALRSEHLQFAIIPATFFCSFREFFTHEVHPG